MEVHEEKDTPENIISLGAYTKCASVLLKLYGFNAEVHMDNTI